MSHSRNNSLYASGTFDAAADTLEFAPSSDCSRVVVSMESASSLTGFNFAMEGQLVSGGAWYVLAMHLSNDVAGMTYVAVSGVLAAVPAYFWMVETHGAINVRIKPSALTGGSCVMRIQAAN